MPPSDEHPLRALEGLTIAVVGAQGSGKSALVADLLSQCGVSPPPRLQIASPRPRIGPPALVTHVLRSAPVLHLRNLLAGVRTALRNRLRIEAFEKHEIKTAGAPVRILEATGERGIMGIARATASLSGVHLILFCTRLDESRAVTDERLQLMYLLRSLGPRALECTLFVLTHGCARPPYGLDFAQYVRGRRDFLWKTIKQIVPPARRGEPHLFREQSTIPFSTTIPEGFGGTEKGTITFERMFPSPFFVRYLQRRFARRNRRSSAEGEGGEQGDSIAGDARSLQALAFAEAQDENLGDRADQLYETMGKLPELLKNADTSLHPLAQLEQVDVIRPEEDMEEYALYEDAPPPEVAVVELSGLCLTNDDGDRVLPDGTPWFDALVAAAAKRAAWDEMDAEEQGALIVQGGLRENGGWRRRVLKFVHRSLHDARVRLILEALILGTLVNLSTFTYCRYMEARERRRVREKKDLIVEIDDEEFERLTKVDPDRGLMAFDLDTGGRVDESAIEKGDFSKTLEDAELDFFGPQDDDSAGNLGSNRQNVV